MVAATHSGTVVGETAQEADSPAIPSIPERAFTHTLGQI